jgi:hypothetical protein
VKRFLIGLFVGIVAGAAASYFLLWAPAREVVMPGRPIQAPDPNLPANAAAAEIVLRPEMFNQVLGTIFDEMKPPVFPLGTGTAGGSCQSQVTVLREGSGVATAAAFDEQQIGAVLAFNGNYNSMLGCIAFAGSARTTMDLYFDEPTNSVFGRLNVRGVQLQGVNPIVGAIVTPLVQSTLNQRVNPVKIIDGSQLAVDLPLAATEADLKAEVSDIRAETRENALHLYVFFEFSGEPSAPGPVPTR